MANGIYTAMAGAVAQSDALDVTANNVANASTTGFRAERVSFGEALTRADGKSMAMVQAGGRRGIDNTAGTLQQTGNALDVAIEGDAYFAVDGPQGVRYTRAGDFRPDADGMLVTADGLPVRGVGGGGIQIPPGTAAVAIGGDGTIEADGVPIGQLELKSFAPGSLKREGESLFVAQGAALDVGPDVNVVAGAIEGANFDVVRGVVDLIKVSRTYEALTRMIDSYKTIDSRTARDIGGPK
jgi:flagellar basal-body rod protein FlgF